MLSAHNTASLFLAGDWTQYRWGTL